MHAASIARAPEGTDEQRRLFWLQFQDPTHGVVLGDKLKQLEELQKMARPAMEDMFRVLWRKEPVPTSYFELVRRLQEGRAQIRRWQQSACREGARQAWAAMQTHYPTLNLTPIAEKCPME